MEKLYHENIKLKIMTVPNKADLRARNTIKKNSFDKKVSLLPATTQTNIHIYVYIT